MPFPRPSVSDLSVPEQAALSEREQHGVGAERVHLMPLTRTAFLKDLEGEPVVQLVVGSRVGEVEREPIVPGGHVQHGVPLTWRRRRPRVYGFFESG